MLLIELNSTRASVGCERTENLVVLAGDGNEWKQRSVALWRCSVGIYGYFDLK
jgi:hypothetical protein